MIELTVNGKSHTLDVSPDTPLLWVIRETLGRTGAKFGCGRALGGVCTVHVDGRAARSCVTLLSVARGRNVTTIEALARGARRAGRSSGAPGVDRRGSAPVRSRLTRSARLAYEERFGEYGNQWVFFAIDAETKLVPHFEVGKPNMVTAYRLMDGLKAKLDPKFQLTSDGFVPYIGAVEHAWGADSPDFAQLVKLYGATSPGPARDSPPKIVEAVPTVVWGNPDPAHISMSYIERANLTVRMARRRFTRLTSAFSKKFDNLKAAMALHFAWYNLVRIHRSLRVTPAMAAGVTNRVGTGRPSCKKGVR